MSGWKGRRGAATRAFITLVLRPVLVATGFVAIAGLRATAGAQEWSSLFDGTTLAGWEGSAEFFRVEDGAIVGGRRTAPTPRNEFLCTTREFDDFVLRLQFRLDAGVNSGVQIRSRRVPGSNEVSGYQADLGDGWWGALYDEARRDRALVRPDAAVVERALERDGWNDYEIVAQGRRIRLLINGQPMIDYSEAEPDIEQRGHVCLQIHSGPPGEVRFRNIVWKRLEPSRLPAPSDSPRTGGPGPSLDRA